MIFEEKTFLFGVGAGKSGTTWLHRYLSRRGDIFMPRPKELHYFDAKYRPDMVGPARKRRLKSKKYKNAADPERGAESLHDDHAYREFFRKRVPEDINVFGEITPGYALIGEQVYRKIRELFPHIRVIFLMRDPVERFYSHVRMNRNNRAARSLPPQEIAELLNHPRYTELSAYEHTIRALEAVFARDEIVYLFYETLFRDETVAALCDFLGVDYRPADFEDVAKSGGTHDPISPLLHERFMEKFQPTYRFCRQKFGADLPKQWHGGEENVAAPES